MKSCQSAKGFSRHFFFFILSTNWACFCPDYLIVHPRVIYPPSLHCSTLLLPTGNFPALVKARKHLWFDLNKHILRTYLGEIYLRWNQSGSNPCMEVQISQMQNNQCLHECIVLQRRTLTSTVDNVRTLQIPMILGWN